MENRIKIKLYTGCEEPAHFKSDRGAVIYDVKGFIVHNCTDWSTLSEHEDFFTFRLYVGKIGTLFVD